MHNYNINEKNVLMHEIIGLKAEIIDSTNKNEIQIKGKIIDETKNMLYIETPKKVVKIAKKNVKILLNLPNKKKVEFNGKIIVLPPEERTKILWRQIYARMQ